MKLFELQNWELQVRDETWGYPVFNKLLKRDKTKNKTTVHKELMFIWSFADIKSDFLYLTNAEEREVAIKKAVGLPEKWKKDKDIDEAIEFYKSHSATIIRSLYEGAAQSASDITEYLKKTKALLEERDDRGKPVYTLNSITASIKSVPVIMRDLKSAYKEVIKEEKDLDNRSKGSREFNTFEEGLDFDEE